MATDVRAAKFELSATDGVTPILNKVDSALGKLEISYATLLKTAGGLTAGLSVGALIAAGQHTIDLADEMGKMSQRVGVSVESLSTLRYAADLSGVSMEDLEGLLVKLNKKLGEASVGSADAAQFLKQFGVDVAGVRDGTVKTDEALKQIADRFATTPDGINKTAAATELFGKQAGKMIPFLNQGREGIEALESEARKLGIQLSSETAKKAEEFNDQMRALKFASEGATLAIIEGLLPKLTEVSAAMKEGAMEGGKLVAVYRALQTLYTGGDQAKNNKALVDLTEEKMKLQAIIDKGTAPNMPFVKARMAQIDAELATTMTYRKELEKTAAAEEEAAKRREDAKKQGTQIVLPKTGGPAGPSDYDKLIASIREKILIEAAEYNATEKLTDGQKLQYRIINDLAEGKLKLTKRQRDTIDAGLEELIASEQLNDSLERLKKTEDEWQKARAANNEAAGKAIVAMEEANQKLRDANEEIGLTAEQLDLLKTRRAEDAAATARQTLETLRNNETSQDELDLLERKVAALDEAARLQRAGAAQRRFAETSKKMEDDAKRSAENIERALTDSLMRGFESGKSAAENFRDTLYNMFRTLVLKPIIEAQVKPFADAANQVIGSVSGGGLLGRLFGTSNYATAIGSDAFNDFRPPGFVAGGRPAVGRVSMVGEAGPELFVPDTAGTIVPNGALQGGAPSVKVEVINKGQPLSARAQSPRWDGHQWVIGVLVDALRSNDNLRQSLSGALSAPRG